MATATRSRAKSAAGNGQYATSAKEATIRKAITDANVRFLRLQFTDLLGGLKNVEIPIEQLDKALDNGIMFDGSSIEGFSRIQESDMRLHPDLDTFQVFPWTRNDPQGATARFLCDVHNPDGTPFAGCPRLTLKRNLAILAAQGYAMMVGPELEFFLFERDEKGHITETTTDAAGYFDLHPVDKGETARKAMVLALQGMGYEVEAAHHEVAPAQHEIDFKYTDALKAADNIVTFRFIVKTIAQQMGLHATFMPKPIFGVNGSGMHTNQSLFKKETNVFFDKLSETGLSRQAEYYIAGLLEHIRSFCAITNPLINSYKRLVPGYEAPVNIAWSQANRSPLIRIPAARGNSTRIELRSPDPSCNPYLALAVMSRSGLDGIERQLEPPKPVNENVYEMTEQKKKRLKIGSLPGNLQEAVLELQKSPLMREILGDHIFEHFIAAKLQEWEEYNIQVTAWEQQRYFKVY